MDGSFTGTRSGINVMRTFGTLDLTGEGVPPKRRDLFAGV
jgi:hypothetical protein